MLGRAQTNIARRNSFQRPYIYSVFMSSPSESFSVVALRCGLFLFFFSKCFRMLGLFLFFSTHLFFFLSCLHFFMGALPTIFFWFFSISCFFFFYIMDENPASTSEDVHSPLLHKLGSNAKDKTIVL